jgi:hypothetical protein
MNNEPVEAVDGATGAAVDISILMPSGESLVIPCHILGTRCYFGRDEVKIEPIGGSGSTWVSVTRIVNRPAGQVQ